MYVYMYTCAKIAKMFYPRCQHSVCDVEHGARARDAFLYFMRGRRRRRRMPHTQTHTHNLVRRVGRGWVSVCAALRLRCDGAGARSTGRVRGAMRCFFTSLRRRFAGAAVLVINGQTNRGALSAYPPLSSPPPTPARPSRLPSIPTAPAIRMVCVCPLSRTGCRRPPVWTRTSAAVHPVLAARSRNRNHSTRSQAAGGWRSDGCEARVFV